MEAGRSTRSLSAMWCRSSMPATPMDSRPRWITMMRETMEGLGPKILATRMVRDYVTDLYHRLPSRPARCWTTMWPPIWPRGSSGCARRGMAWPSTGWKAIFPTRWPWSSRNVFSAWVKLGSLEPTDVSVQVVSGGVDADDQIHNVRIFELAPTDQVDQQEQLFRVTWSLPSQVRSDTPCGSCPSTPCCTMPLSSVLPPSPRLRLPNRTADSLID